jgi:hypothetical protein
MTRKPTTQRKRSKKPPTSQRILTWLDRAISDTNREALSSGMRELGYGSFDKSVISKINKDIRGLSADEMYAIGALTETDIPNALSVHEMAAMRREARRAAGNGHEPAAPQVAVLTEEWLRSPNRVDGSHVGSPGHDDDDGIDDGFDSDTDGSASDGGIEMDANAEREMKILVSEAFAALLGQKDKEVAVSLYEMLQVLARRKLASAESPTAEGSSRKEVLGLMTALGLQPPK